MALIPVLVRGALPLSKGCMAIRQQSPNSAEVMATKFIYRDETIGAVKDDQVDCSAR